MSSLTRIASSCVLILAVIALRALFGKKIRLEIRYLLWGLVLLRLLLPFEIGRSGWSVASVVQRAEWTRLSQNFTALPDFETAGDAGDAAGFMAASEDTHGLSAEKNALPAESAAEPVTSAVQWRSVLRCVRYAGTAITAVIFFASNLRLYVHLRRRRVPLDSSGRLKVYSVQNLSSSCLFLRSIYVSDETAADSVKLRHVLAHELAHHRHGDGVWALLRCAAVALHWYNPLVWWAAALSRRDSELFADEGALKFLGEDEREEYGVTLIQLSAKQPASASLLCTATTMTGGKRALKERVVMIARKPRAALWAVVIVGAAAALAVGATLAGAAEPDADKSGETEDVQWDESPKLTLFGTRYRQIELTPLDAPPENYAFAGRLTEAQAGDTGAAGCAYYLDLRTDSVPDIYVFMPFASTGIGAAGDSQPQWAYFRWVNEKIPPDAPDADAPGKTEDLQWVSFADASEAPRGFSMPADLDHDGVQETVEVQDVRREDGFPIGAVVSVPGSELSFELNISHAGWGSIFKYVSPDDGRDYLLYYVPNFSTGIGTYWYELYNLSGLLRSNEVEFCVGPLGSLDLDGEKMEAFSDEINALLEHSILLASTDGGELRLGPAPAEPYYETYALPLSVFPYEGQEEAADLTLAERIEYYESVIWADFMMGTLPLFTEDVSQFLWYLSSHDLDWHALWELDNGATPELIGALRGYVAANELNDGDYNTLLLRTRGLDGACAEAYAEVLDALWQQGGARYLRLWAELTEEEQNRAIPYHVHEAVNFAGLEAARAWMNESAALGVTEVPERAETYTRPAPAAGRAADFAEVPG